MCVCHCLLTPQQVDNQQHTVHQHIQALHQGQASPTCCSHSAMHANDMRLPTTQHNTKEGNARASRRALTGHVCLFSLHMVQKRPGVRKRFAGPTAHTRMHHNPVLVVPPLCPIHRRVNTHNPPIHTPKSSVLAAHSTGSTGNVLHRPAIHTYGEQQNLRKLCFGAVKLLLKHHHHHHHHNNPPTD